METYRDYYGDENPWVMWLRQYAPQLLSLTPNELRRYLRGDEWQGPKDWDRRVA